MNTRITWSDDAIRRALRAISVGSFVFQCEVAGRLGLHYTDLQALHRLGLAGGTLSAGDLGAHLGLTSGATTTAIDRLEVAGFVERIGDSADRRRTLVRVRPAAVRRLRRQYVELDERVDAAIATLDEPARDVVAEFLHRVAYPPTEVGRQRFNRPEGPP